MSKNMIINLSTSELNDLEKKVNNWSVLLQKAGRNIVKDLSEYALEQMQKTYSKAQKEYQDSTPMDFSITGTEYEKKVTMSGEQAIYDEFGTGTIGSENSHPQKSEFDLNPYNSGKTIRVNKSSTSKASENNIPVGGLYWTYKKDGKRIYTQGIPAQKEGYNSFKATSKKAPSVIRKRVEEALK